MTTIEWAHETWNPFIGCTMCSHGCHRCYAMALAWRLANMGRSQYDGVATKDNWTGQINRNSEAAFYKPLKRKKPTIYFVNSMSDFWHSDANPEWRAEALDIMTRCRQHVFQILTKRPHLINHQLTEIGERIPPNVWLGTTCEDERVTHRIGEIKKVQAATKFLSVEPITRRVGPLDLDEINWVITGGESGHRRRRLRPNWVREVRDQCLHQSIPYFHKQWGHYHDNPLVSEQGMSIEQAKLLDPPANGKGGALIDGLLWRQWPKAAADFAL